MDPATSVPMPIVDPLKAIFEPSPPLLPPEVKWLITGFFVCPNTLLSASATNMVCGTLVFAITIAPAALTNSITYVVVVDGLKVREIYPLQAS